MNKKDNDKLQTVDYIALTLLLVGVIGVFLIPFLVTKQSWIWSFGELKANEIGDTIGGITAPFVALISAGLVYLALREQVKANRLISIQIDESRIEKVELAIVNGLISEIDAISQSYKGMIVTECETNRKYRGQEAANMIFNSIFHRFPNLIESPIPYLDNLNKVGNVILKFNHSNITQKHLIKEFDVALTMVLPFTLIRSFESLRSEVLRKESLKTVRLKYGILMRELEKFHEKLIELKLH